MAGAPLAAAMTDEGAGAFLARLTAKLAAAGVPNMVVGSFARSTAFLAAAKISIS